MSPFTTYTIPEISKSKTDDNTKWLYILLDQAPSAQDEQLLQKICEALKADFEMDVELIIVSKDHPIMLVDHISSSSRMILSFGIKPTLVGVWIDLNSPGMKYLESYCFILTVALHELNNLPAAKKELWSAMQSFLHREKEMENEKSSS